MTTDELIKCMEVKTDMLSAQDHAKLLKLYQIWHGQYKTSHPSIADQTMSLRYFEEAVTIQCVDLHV